MSTQAIGFHSDTCSQGSPPEHPHDQPTPDQGRTSSPPSALIPVSVTLGVNPTSWLSFSTSSVRTGWMPAVFTTVSPTYRAVPVTYREH